MSVLRHDILFWKGDGNMNHSFFHPEKQYGETLPVFDHEWEAIAFYYDYRQSQTEELKELCQFFNISLDYSRS